jgi:Fe-S-cluster formation regulator IscX/YfhJ
MPLSVIGSGFGRTGTKSLKLALETLGFTPCHHMLEVRATPGQVDFWLAIARREKVDWHAVFAGFRAAVDWPSCNYWRELAEAFPDAKVIHTTRPEEEWWRSFSRTIAEALGDEAPTDDPARLKMREMTATIITRDVFAGRLHDKEAALAAFRRREAEVRAAIPPGRLLMLDPTDGWEKLCPFLGVPVPDCPYPLTNTTEDFKANLSALRRA